MKLLKDIFKCNYLALGNNVNDKVKGFYHQSDAIKFLEDQSVKGKLMYHCVIDAKLHKIVWYESFMGKIISERRLEKLIELNNINFV